MVLPGVAGLQATEKLGWAMWSLRHFLLGMWSLGVSHPAEMAQLVAGSLGAVGKVPFR